MKIAIKNVLKIPVSHMYGNLPLVEVAFLLLVEQIFRAFQVELQQRDVSLLLRVQIAHRLQLLVAPVLLASLQIQHLRGAPLALD